MVGKPLYGVYVWLTPESLRSYTPERYGGARAESVHQAVQCFMRQQALSYVEKALVLRISEQGEVLGGEYCYRVACLVLRQQRVSRQSQQRMHKLFSSKSSR